MLDCPPALDLLTLNAYTCAQELYVSAEAQLCAADGIAKVPELTAWVRQQLNLTLCVRGNFFTRFDLRKVWR